MQLREVLKKINLELNLHRLIIYFKFRCLTENDEKMDY